MENTIVNTLYEMLSDRGYDSSTFTWYDNRLSIEHNSKKTYVYLLVDTKIGINTIKNIRSDTEDNNIKHIILVYSHNITSHAKQHLDSMVHDGYLIEIFKDKELYFNITKHELVPKHELLTNDEKTNLLKTLNVKSNNLPFIKQSDPVAKYMGLKKGDVVKIYRKSEISESSIYYRICV